MGTEATPLQVLAMFMQMNANLGTPTSLVHRRRVDPRGTPLRGALVSGPRACVDVDGIVTPYVSFEALVEDGWRFDLPSEDAERQKRSG
jgi:hypothetical protein